jgi:hypothetical protein
VSVYPSLGCGRRDGWHDREGRGGLDSEARFRHEPKSKEGGSYEKRYEASTAEAAGAWLIHPRQDTDLLDAAFGSVKVVWIH